MKTTGMLKALALSTLFAVLGCSPTVEDICSDLEDDCSVDYHACNRHGSSLESSAATHGCSDRFEEYLDCLPQAGCGWASLCEPKREALEACMGPLPPAEEVQSLSSSPWR